MEQKISKPRDVYTDIENKIMREFSEWNVEKYDDFDILANIASDWIENIYLCRFEYKRMNIVMGYLIDHLKCINGTYASVTKYFRTVANGKTFFFPKVGVHDAFINLVNCKFILIHVTTGLIDAESLIAKRRFVEKKDEIFYERKAEEEFQRRCKVLQTIKL